MIQTKTQTTPTKHTQSSGPAVHTTTPHVVPTTRVTAGLHHQAQTRSISGSLPSASSPAIGLPASLSSLSDHELLMLCTHYGTQAKVWKQRFLGLLPEVERRRLYLTKGCSSVFEFAAKLGGVSREQVLLTLRLDKRFDATPELKQALTSGEVSVHKLARVASVVAPDNQTFWLQKSKILSQAALEVLVKDSKSMRTHALKPNKTEKIPQSDELKLSPNIRERLLALQNKGINLEELLEEFLIQREESIQRQKQQIAEEIKKEGKPSRYIPTKVKRLLKQEYGEKCAHQHCINKAINTHHKLRFALDPTHNPVYLVPVCKQHHEIAHALDFKVQKKKKEFCG